VLRRPIETPVLPDIEPRRFHSGAAIPHMG
jgi:hypothetical protein